MKKTNICLAIFLLVLLIWLMMVWCVQPCSGHTGKCLVVFNVGTLNPVNMWLWFMFFLLTICVTIGYAIKGRLAGVLIDQRNMMSLSRLQLVMWTILLLSAFLVAVLINLCLPGIKDPLMITMSQQLWALMGISGASLTASGLVHAAKRSQERNSDAEHKTLKAMKNETMIRRQTDPRFDGKLMVNESPREASWLDLFAGEESGNGAWMDIGKVQMFIFTLIVWFSYASTLASFILTAVSKPDGFSAFPDLSQGMVALLAISHAAYIGNIAIPQTPEQRKDSEPNPEDSN